MRTSRNSPAARLIAFGLTSALSCLLLPGTNAAAAAGPKHGLRTLTTVHEAHSLSTVEAERGYPVHLRGVITYADPYIDPRQDVLFINDASGSMFISGPVGLNLSPGTKVEVRGVTGMGDFAPVIAKPHVVAIGPSHLPPQARAVSLTRLLTGVEDGQWVEVEGVVHSVYQTEHDVTMQLAMRDGLIPVTTVREAGQDYNRLVDARVRVHANAAPLFNGDRQMIGVRLLTPNLSTIAVQEPGPEDVFSLPVQPIRSLSSFNTMAALPRRVHVQGRVTLAWPGALVCVRDDAHGVCARGTQIDPAQAKSIQTNQTTTSHLAIGQMADLAGFVETGGAAPALIDAVAKGLTRYSAALISPVPVTAAQALQGKFDSELVQLDGQLIGRDLAAFDTTLILSSDRFVYTVQLPASMADASSKELKIGSRLRITGICSVEIDVQRTAREGGPAVRKSFRILLRSPQDVVVLQRPSWWTPIHAVAILAAVLSVTLFVLIWVVVLTRRLKQQTWLIRKSEERFRDLAQIDALTGLPNRLMFEDRVRESINHSKSRGLRAAIFTVDIDRFKQINDTYGHDVGDECLKIVAQRLRSRVRQVDTIARTGGEEFTQVSGCIVDGESALRIAQGILGLFSNPIALQDGTELEITVSIGGAIYPDDGAGIETLRKRSDQALYEAKRNGRNRIVLANEKLNTANEVANSIERSLRDCLEHRGFRLCYEPILNAQGAVCRFEALLRSSNQKLTEVGPAVFVSVAEECGLIIPIGRWVVQDACRQIDEWHRLGAGYCPVAVNFSGRELLQKDFVAYVLEVLERYAIPRGMLQIEITETTIMADVALIEEVIGCLATEGVTFAIDDFGTGYSSLSRLHELPIKVLKIDRSFIREVEKNRTSQSIVSAIIQLAKTIQLEVVAEGIENTEQFGILRDLGCDYFQGHLFSPTVPADEAVTLLERDLARKPASLVAQ